jgi:hypothetical protein
MPINGKGIQSLLMNIVLQKIIIINIFEKTPFYASSLGNGLNKVQFGIVQFTYGT